MKLRINGCRLKRQAAAYVGMRTVLVHMAGGSGADWRCERLAEIPALLL